MFAMTKQKKNNKYSQILNHFKKRDPKIHEVMKTIDFNKRLNPDRKAGQKINYFSSLCREIVGQQLSGKAADTIHKRFMDLFLGKEFSPKNILEIDDKKLRASGMSWAKVRYVKDLAQKAESGELDLDQLHKFKDVEVVEKLTTIKGIGAWTAEMFLIFTLGREDVFSFGDLGLKKGIGKIYGVKNPTKIKIEKIISKWAPYKTYGSIALWHSLDV